MESGGRVKREGDAVKALKTCKISRNDRRTNDRNEVKRVKDALKNIFNTVEVVTTNHSPY